MQWKLRLPVLFTLGTLFFFAAPSTAMAGEKVVYKYSCECSWAGWCDYDRTRYTTVRFEKKPNRTVGCMESKQDRAWMSRDANFVCREDGFTGHKETYASGCSWEKKKLEFKEIKTRKVRKAKAKKKKRNPRRRAKRKRTRSVVY